MGIPSGHAVMGTAVQARSKGSKSAPPNSLTTFNAINSICWYTGNKMME